MINPFKSCHITINRACNIRCKFCYAKETGFSSKDDMSMETFDKINNLCKQGGIEKIILIGGEPTIYKDIFKCIRKISAKSLTLVTNGVVLDDIAICKQYIEAGITNFSVSIKSYDRESYKNITKVDAFNRVLKAISNLKKIGASFSVSFVIDKDNVNNILTMMDVAIDAGCDAFFFSFCRELTNSTENDIARNTFNVAKDFEKLLPEIKKRKCRFKYAINEPLCVYSDRFIEENIKDFPMPCYVYNESSLTFDTKGNIIPCNTIYQVKMGQIGKDFFTFEELLKYRENVNYKSIYKKLRGLPDKECDKCKNLYSCFGRCVCNWTNYTWIDLQGWKLFYKKYEQKIDIENYKKILKIINLIHKDNNYEKVTNPTKIIVGEKPYKNCVLNSKINNGREVAFLSNDNDNIPCSLIRIMTLFFGNVTTASIFIDLLREFKICQENFYKYLYYDKGIKLLNAFDKTKNIAISQADFCGVNDVLVCGEKAEKCLVKLKINVQNMGEIIHPSSRCYGKKQYFRSWYMLDSLYLKNVNGNLELNSFKIL